ncbi:MAG: tetratricopeptide repeat protein [Nitrospirota bacterium]
MRKYLLILFLLLTAFLSSCATSKTGENVQRASAHYKLGISYYNNNKIQAAYVEFQKALEFNPNDKEVLNAIGVIYLLNLEDIPKAIEFFERAISIDADFSDAHNNLGYAYEKTGMVKDAIKSYKTALANPLYQTAEKALNNLGRIYYRLGRYDDAIDAYREAIKRVPEFVLPYYGLALCYNAKGKYGDASIAIARAIELDPLYKGNRDRAIEDLKNRKISAEGDEAKDISDYLEILRY